MTNQGETNVTRGEAGRVLIVDDARLNRLKLRHGVEGHGCTCREAEHGSRALELLEQEPFDLVLLDILMPVMNGYQVLETMKSRPAWRNIPVVVVSALDDMDSIVRCIAMGAEDYLTRPFNPVLLHARLTACLEKKRLRDREQELFRKLQDQYARLQELEKLRNDLTNMIVHDLRTPLASVLSALQTFSTLGGLGTMQEELLALGISSTRSLIRMINDLLDISKLEAGTIRLDYADLDPEALVGEALQQVMPLATQRELVVSTRIPPAPPRVYADKDKLLRTLVNLLGNAVRFTPRGGFVTVTVQPVEEEEVLFAVADNGPGIPPEAQDRIFDKFAQVNDKTSDAYATTGLGLTFCKLAVEAHGGRIWVESELGKGSTFFVALPRAAEA